MACQLDGTADRRTQQDSRARLAGRAQADGSSGPPENQRSCLVDRPGTRRILRGRHERIPRLGPGGPRGYFAARAAAGLVLGAAIGLERQWRQPTAGLRTNALVALGAALFELFAVLLSGAHGVDPTRIAAYVVSGTGFLGAGVILRDGVSVRGINTAATIWCSAAVGVLAGAGCIPAAGVAAGLVLLAHLGLRPVARRAGRLPAGTSTEVETTYDFRAVCRTADEAHIRALVVQALARDEFVLHSVRSEDLDHGSGMVEVTAEFQATAATKSRWKRR